VLLTTVTAAMVNAHSICHGGFLFALAESTFACNWISERAVAAHCAVTYVRPARLGMRPMPRWWRRCAPRDPASPTSPCTPRPAQ
jgi:uncharacterized protein (TIGR00369 family)